MPKALFQQGLIALPLVLSSLSACGDTNDTVQLNVGTSVQYDSNLFRLSSDINPDAALGTSSKSDRISTLSAGLSFSKPYSLQLFEFDATAIDYRHQNFDYLDFTALNYAAAWRWRLTPSIHGNLTTRQNEALNSFADYKGYNNLNIRTDNNLRFDATFDVDGVWRLLGAVGRTKRTNSKAFVQEGDTQTTTLDGGVRYASPSGSSLTYVIRTALGEYTNRPQPVPAALLDNRFDNIENEIRLIWPVTGKTTLDGRVAYLERNHEHYAARDYSGMEGNLGIDWEVCGKTRLALTLARELASYQSFSSSYTSTDRLSIAPYWQIDAKTGLRLNYEYAQRKYLGAIAATPLNGREDVLRNGQIALEWQPYRSLLISTSLQADRRTSNQSGQDYYSYMISVSAQASF